MKVYIANFGRGNYEWPTCLERSSVATMNDLAGHEFWSNGDREGFIAHCVANVKTAAGIRPTRPVASRWFNLMTIISETENDIWIHREKEALWWTTSTPELPEISLGHDPNRQGDDDVYVCHKPCERWSDKDLKGNRLEWGALHPRAAEFLFTEGTLQQLGSDNSAYAQSLVAGENLSPWHRRTDWIAKAQKSRKQPGTVFNAREKTVSRMAHTVETTVANASGQTVERVSKIKEMKFKDKYALETYLIALFESQDGVCALTEIPLQLDGELHDKALACSLDRIDSDGHYEEGNLQVVCRFANQWKSDSDDEEFRRLIHVVRNS